MLKTEFCKEITIEEYLLLNKKYGLTVEVNDGQVVTANFEEANDEN